MLINGTAAQIAAAGQRYLRPAKAAQESPDQIIAGPDLPRQLIGDLTVADVGAVHIHSRAVDRLYIRPQLPQDLEDQGHIADLRDILNAAHPIYQQSGGDDSHSGIFGAADFDSTVQGPSATDLILGQILHPLLLQMVEFMDYTAKTAICKSKKALYLHQGAIKQIYYSTIISE